MVIPVSYAKSLLLLFSTALVVIHDHQKNSVNADCTPVECQLNKGAESNAKREIVNDLLWLGPRLGRRKRSEEENRVNVFQPERYGTTLVEFLEGSPWAFVAVKGAKRRNVNFTPRLGRESSEENDLRDSPLEKATANSGNDKSVPLENAPFIPRLGRYAALFNGDQL